MSDPIYKPVVGRGTALKRAVLEALEVWRSERGLGSWLTLAQIAGVTVEDIDQVRQCRKVPFRIYERLAKALGVDGPSIKKPEDQ